MNTITTKFAIGDIVYRAGTDTVRKQHPCPDCMGSRQWKAISPAGSEYEFSCPRCSTSYSSNDALSLAYSAHVPMVTKLTIGSVEANQGTDRGNKYMCVETGVGSGSVYEEHQLHATREAAEMAAQTAADLANSDASGWVAKRYNKTLSLCDYEIGDAALEAARRQQASYSADLQMLFGDLRDSETIASVKETLDAFKFSEAGS